MPHVIFYVLDVLVRLVFWYTGAYQGSKLNRRAWKEYINRAVPTVSGSDKVNTIDADAASLWKDDPIPDNRVLFRLFRPANYRSGRVIFYIHGGGFTIGSAKEHSYDALCKKIAMSYDALVISPEYRLAPEHRFPAGIEDCFSVLLWLSAALPSAPVIGAGGGGARGPVSAAEQEFLRGADRSKVYTMGDSAGGNLAAVICLKVLDNRSAMPQVILPKGQILVYPGFFLSATESRVKHENALVRPEWTGYFFYAGYFGVPQSVMPAREAYRQASARAAKQPYANPLGYYGSTGVTKPYDELPEAVIITAELDPLNDDGIAYAEWLRLQGVPVHFLDIKDTVHGFLTVSMVPEQQNALDFASKQLFASNQ
eukprot:Clim_evm9s37 gene=Clim_evmTU9s37